MQTNHKKIILGLIDSLGLSNYEAIGILEVVKAEIQSRLSSTPVVRRRVELTSSYDDYLDSLTKKDELQERELKRKYTKRENVSVLGPARPKRQLSEEQKKSLIERIAKARESKRLKKLEKKHITIPSNGQTSLKDWADILIMKNKIKQRLYNGLIKLHNRGFFLEDTHQQAFLEVENIGMDSWREFLKLRFEHFSKQ